jgi:hypothetical protein
LRRDSSAAGQDDVDAVVRQDEAAGAGSGEISVETARMPVGRIAAMKPEPRPSPASARGSARRHERRARDRAAIWVCGSGLLSRRMKAAAGGRGRPGLPLQVLGFTDWPSRCRLGDENLDGRQLSARTGRLLSPLADTATPRPARDENDNACGTHTPLTLTRDTRTARGGFPFVDE